MEIIYSENAKKHIDYWKHSGNIQAQKKIQSLLFELKETPYTGTGQPEQLKYGLSGCWSRRINLEHRIVYEVDESVQLITIHSLKGHYEK
jgi:toxin YoeB